LDPPTLRPADSVIGPYLPLISKLWNVNTPVYSPYFNNMQKNSKLRIYEAEVLDAGV